MLVEAAGRAPPVAVTEPAAPTRRSGLGVLGGFGVGVGDPGRDGYRPERALEGVRGLCPARANSLGCECLFVWFLL